MKRKIRNEGMYITSQKVYGTVNAFCRECRHCANIVKIVCDALNGIAYGDDRQIALVQIRKKYAEEPKTDVRLWEI